MPGGLKDSNQVSRDWKHIEGPESNLSSPACFRSIIWLVSEKGVHAMRFFCFPQTWALEALEKDRGRVAIYAIPSVTSPSYTSTALQARLTSFLILCRHVQVSHTAAAGSDGPRGLSDVAVASLCSLRQRWQPVASGIVRAIASARRYFTS